MYNDVHPPLCHTEEFHRATDPLCSAHPSPQCFLCEALLLWEVWLSWDWRGELTRGWFGVRKGWSSFTQVDILSICFVLDIDAGSWNRDTVASRTGPRLPQPPIVVEMMNVIVWQPHGIWKSNNEWGERRTEFLSWLCHRLALWHGTNGLVSLPLSNVGSGN